MGSDQKATLGAQGRSDQFSWDPDDLIIIDTPGHPLYDERIRLPVNEALVETFLAGMPQIEPIRVRYNGRDAKTGKPIVEVVVGRQRVRAMREANRRLLAENPKAQKLLVRGEIVRSDDMKLRAIKVIENEQREADPPIVKAQKAQELLDAGYDVRQVATFMAVTPQTVTKTWLPLLNLNEEVRRELVKGSMSTQVALELATIPREEQTIKFETLKSEDKLFGRAGQDAAAEAVGRPKRARASSTTGGGVRGKREIQNVITRLEEHGGQHPSAITVLKWVLHEGDLAQRWTGSDE